MTYPAQDETIDDVLVDFMEHKKTMARGRNARRAG